MEIPPQQQFTCRPRLRRATRLKLAIAALAVIGGSGTLALLGDGSSAEAAAPMSAVPQTALTVGVTTPQRLTLARTIAASGSIGARDELLIGSDATGVRLVEVRVEVGAKVARGQLLARGDDSQLLAQLAQQDAQIRQAKAELAQADANLERALRLEDSGVYSTEQIQTRRTNAEAAAAKLELAQAQRRELAVRIAQTRVLAPADGVIASRSATVGAVVQPGIELFRLIRDEQLEWLAELPGHSLQRVVPGAPVRIHLDGGGSVEASVRLVAPTIDAKTRNGLVHVALPPGTPLKAGGHASGEIAVAAAEMLTLPEASVFVRDGQPFVYAIGDDDVARLQRIETGMRRRGLVEVTGGIDAHTRVIATGAGFVKDGERVRVADEQAKAVMS